MRSIVQDNTLEGPFGPADLVRSVPTQIVAAQYMIKCGVDVTPHFHGHSQMDLYRCRATGMLFWRPEVLAGSEEFYHLLSSNWNNYYQDWRWEYGLLGAYFLPTSRILEIGCGRGYFLRSTEGKVSESVGIELNAEAIATKVTSWPVLATTVEDLTAAHAASFDLVCAFQVLEHVVDPSTFIEGALACLRPGGRLALSVPNFENVTFRAREDAFDLPPHHVNHFTPEAMVKIAARFKVQIEAMEIEPRSFQLEHVTANTARKLPYRVARKLALRIFRKIYWHYNEPGPTMLTVFRKAA